MKLKDFQAQKNDKSVSNRWATSTCLSRAKKCVSGEKMNFVDEKFYGETFGAVVLSHVALKAHQRSLMTSMGD